jgi:3-deoxy-7-phosphoheptulonate synthase
VRPSAPNVMLLDPEATDSELADVLSAAGTQLSRPQVTRGDGWAAVPLGDGIRPLDADQFGHLAPVRRLVQVTSPYRLASRQLFGRDLGVQIPLWENGARVAPGPTFGGKASLGIIVSSRWAAASETRLQVLAPLVRAAGCSVFHAGRLTLEPERAASSGVPLESLRRLRDAAHEHELALCVEVAEANQIESAVEFADVLQVGSGNMQDFSLLREMGRTTRPIILRRGVSATVEEFLLAAEYVLVHGNGKVILCESGIRTFAALQRPRFEINAVPLIQRLSHLPLIADPSQTAPHATAVPAMARAATAAGADGLILEVGTEAAYDQEGAAIDIETMRRLMAELRPIARAVGRTFGVRGGDNAAPPSDAMTVLQRTDQTLAQTIESLTDSAPQLDVVAQWRLAPPVPWLSPPLSRTSEILARCSSYRMGSVRLACTLSYVDLSRIDSTLVALLEAQHVSLAQLFVDPRIEQLDYTFGSSETAGPVDEALRRFFPDELHELYPYAWRRYEVATDGQVAFVVIEALPVPVWEYLLDSNVDSAAAMSVREGTG